VTRFEALREAIFGAPKDPEPLKKDTTIIVSAIEKNYGVRLSTSFKDQLKVYNEDGLIKQKILEFGQEVISTGYFTTMDETYKLVLGGKTAKEVVDEWNRVNDIDSKLSQMAAELTAFGNSFWHVTKGGFVNVPIESIDGAVKVRENTPVREEYHLKLTGEYGMKLLRWGEFLHPKINVTGKAPLGTGIILGLIACPDSDTPSIYEVRKVVRSSINDAFLRFSQTNSLWSFPEASDDNIKALSLRLTAMKTGQKSQRIATNVKGSIALEIPERTSSFDKWIEQIDKEFYAALGTGITPDTEYTTKATAEAIREYYEMRISNLRRVIKRVMEGVWTKVLDEAGYEGIKANVKLHFGSQEIDYATADVFAAVDKRIISKEEARVILREYMKWRLETKLPEDLAKETPTETPPTGGKTNG